MQKDAGVKRRKVSDNNQDSLARNMPDEVKVLSDCLHAYLTDVEMRLDIRLRKDAEVIKSRALAQGLGFLGDTLSEFWSWITQSLEAGKLCQPPPRLKLSHRQSNRPALLQGLVSIIFGDDGKAVYPGDDEELASRIALAVESLNTICNSFGKKYEAPLRLDTKNAMLTEFMDFDKYQVLDLSADLEYLSVEAQMVLKRARSYLVRLFEDYDSVEVRNGVNGPVTHSFWNMPLKPRFGPRACTEGYDAYGKYRNLFASPPIKAIGRLGLFDISQPSPQTVNGLPPKIYGEQEVRELIEDNDPVMTTIVPKSHGKGREICPMKNDKMYLQKAYQANIYDWVEKHPLTAGFVNFTDQSINGKLALQASADRCMATVDLRKASNTVGKGHVGMLFDERISEMLFALRQNRVGIKCVEKVGISFRNGRFKLITEEKVESWNAKMYAPMGSALCFPVEALVFWAIAKATLDVAELPGNRDVYVFGDDILIPTSGYEILTTVFSEVGFVVNRKKSFSKGYFRESCGVDAYLGRCVKPAFRISKRIPNLGQDRNQNSGSCIAWVDYANMAEREGLYFLAEALRCGLNGVYPKSRGFPKTGEFQETCEGFLAFFVDGFDSIRSRLAKKVKRPHVIYKVLPNSGQLILRKKLVGGHGIFSEVYIKCYVPPQKGSQGTFFGPSVQAPTLNLYAQTSKEIVLPRTKVRYEDQNPLIPIRDEKDEGPETMPEELAYMRWVLEASGSDPLSGCSKDLYRFPIKDTLDIRRERFSLS